jgi:hypothetical protein
MFRKFLIGIIILGFVVSVIQLTSVSAENVTSYSVGDKVIVSLKQGFWGYPIIQSVE